MTDHFKSPANPADSAPISEWIKYRLFINNKRFFANDNISEAINEGDLDLLIEEVATKFEGVLDSLVIDRFCDPNSKGTAKRLAKMYINELFSGRYQPPPEVTSFPNDGGDGNKPYNGMLVVRADLKSVCSHHHQPVTGVAYIGVIPTGKVIGLSKYVRIAQHCARRGTLQEQLTNDIAESIMKATKSENVAVHIAASHGCMENRGVMASCSPAQTTVLHGLFYSSQIKDEFYDQIKLQSSQNRYSCI